MTSALHNEHKRYIPGGSNLILVSAISKSDMLVSTEDKPSEHSPRIPQNAGNGLAG